MNPYNKNKEKEERGNSVHNVKMSSTPLRAVRTGAYQDNTRTTITVKKNSNFVVGSKKIRYSCTISLTQHSGHIILDGKLNFISKNHMYDQKISTNL